MSNQVSIRSDDRSASFFLFFLLFFLPKEYHFGLRSTPWAQIFLFLSKIKTEKKQKKRKKGLSRT